MSENKQQEKVYYMLTFHRRLSHPVQVYIKTSTFVPMRFNHKDSDVRKIIYEVRQENHDQFLNILRTLIEVQGREIKVSNVADVFCDACGCKYEYRMDNRTGKKVCAECGGTNFIK